MKKFFLMQCKFQTGTLTFDQTQILTITHGDMQGKPFPVDTPEETRFSEVATIKFKKWFRHHFPESQLIYVTAQAAIEDMYPNEEVVIDDVDTLHKQIETLKQWKSEALEVLGPIMDFMRENDKDMKIGESISKRVIMHLKKSMGFGKFPDSDGGL